MLTTSEMAVTATIWILTAAGGFFGARAMVRKSRKIPVRQESDIRRQGQSRSAREF